jgi:hypothetical protein
MPLFYIKITWIYKKKKKYKSNTQDNINVIKRIWRYQSSNLQFKEEQTTQWPKERGQTTIYKTLHWKLDQATQTPLKQGVNSGAAEG